VRSYVTCHKNIAPLMILLNTWKQRRKNEEVAKIIMVKKSPWCNNFQLNNVQPLIRDVIWQTSKCYLINVSSL